MQRIMTIIATFVAVQLGGLFLSTSPAFAGWLWPTTPDSSGKCACPTVPIKTESCCDTANKALKKAKEARAATWRNYRRIKKLEKKIDSLSLEELKKVADEAKSAAEAAKKSADEAKADRADVEDLLKRIKLLEVHLNSKIEELEKKVNERPAPTPASTPPPAPTPASTPPPAPTPASTPPPAPTRSYVYSGPGPTSEISGLYLGAFGMGQSNFPDVDNNARTLSGNVFLRWVSEYYVGLQISGGLGAVWYEDASPFFGNLRGELQFNFNSMIVHFGGQFSHFDAPYKGESNYTHGIVDGGISGRFGVFEVGATVGGAFHSERPDHGGLWLGLRLGVVYKVN